MEIENSTILGTAMITFTSLLAAYYLILRIREFHREKPDPKLTYATHAQMEKVRSEMMRAISEAVQDLRALRAEIREDTRALQKQYSRALSDNRDLIAKNAQNISALIAQSQTASQRISELSLKTDRIVMRLKEDM